MDIIFAILGMCMFYFAMKYYKWKEYERNKVVGDIGEKIVANKLMELSEEYEVCNNVHLDKAQIDHLVICKSEKIAYVIETKMWSGIITGKSGDTKWIQNKNGKIRYFDNPIKQNRYHCNVVRRYYTGYHVYSVIVFVGNTSIPNGTSVTIVDKLVEYINKITNKVSNKGRIDIQTDW